MTIAWLLEDERSDAVDKVLRHVMDNGALVPSIWRLEVANMLRVAVRRGRCDEATVDRAIDMFIDLPIAIDEETDLHAWNSTLALARAEGLTLYDAAYLELAKRRRLPLATLDRDLVAAATKQDVPIFTL